MSTPVTVGCVVYYWPAADDQLQHPRPGQPLAANVAAVSEDGGSVNLHVIDANGFAHSRLEVPFVQADKLPPAVGSYAAWMPYQVAQAAKSVSDVADPVIETKTYSDGSTATGVAPLPDTSPAEQTYQAEPASAADAAPSTEHPYAEPPGDYPTEAAPAESVAAPADEPVTPAE